jgi:CO/xanthine dehydrogenase Mo-binding subunit
MRGLALGAVEGMAKAIPGWVGPIMGVEGADHPYAVPNVSVESVAWDPGIPVGIWRSVGHSHNGFVVESFIDELAHAAGEDPAAFRRRLLAGHPRHIAVLDLLLEKARWGRPPPGRHQGMAIHEAFGTVAGQVAEIAIEGDAIRVHRVTCAVDCGLAVNPDIVEAQMESGIVFGLTAALHGEITFRDGAAVESNFHDHPMLRMAQVPAIEVAIVPSAESPSGVGEPGTPPIAPAVANAVFAATGQRLRELPLRLA